MRKQLAIMAEPIDARTWLAANTEFHAAVYRRANRPRTIELIEQLRRLTDRYVYLHLEVIGQTGHIGSEHDDDTGRRRMRAMRPLTARLTSEHLAKAHDHILD